MFRDERINHNTYTGNFGNGDALGQYNQFFYAFNDHIYNKNVHAHYYKQKRRCMVNQG